MYLPLKRFCNQLTENQINDFINQQKLKYYPLNFIYKKYPNVIITQDSSSYYFNGSTWYLISFKAKTIRNIGKEPLQSI